MTSLLVAVFLLLALALAVGAQSKPTITVTSSREKADSGEQVTFKLSYTLPQSNDLTPPGVFTATWSANADFVKEEGGAVQVKSNELRWNYPGGLPVSTQLPTFILKVGELSDSIHVTATLIVSDTEDSTQKSAVTRTVATVLVVPPATADLSQSSLKIDPAGDLQAGSPISLSVIISNTGMGPAEAVMFTFPSDVPLTDISISPASAKLADEVTPASGSFEFRLKESIPPQWKVTVVLDARLATSVAGDVKVSGSVAAKGMEPQAMASQPLPIVQPTPTATLTPADTPTATPTSAPTDTLAPASPTSVPPLSDGESSTNNLTLLLIGIGALLFALIIGTALYLLLRGRRKPAPPETPSSSPTPPEPAPQVTAPLPVGSAFLESVALPGMRIRLGSGVTTIGRAADSTIRIDERTMNWETVSRVHAEIRQEGGNYVIYDVSPDRRSSNGVYVQGQRTVRNLLRPGWRIGIGGVEFIFRDAAAGTQ